MVVVLMSGGLDSAVLLADEGVRGKAQPVYVSVGLAWEPAERETLAALLTAGAFPADGRRLVSLSVEMRDVYAETHWAVTGRPPAYHTADEDVYLPGRNIILLGKASVYCAMAGVDRIAIGTLGHNPFPDATPEFRAAMADALSRGLGHTLRIEAPYAEMSKAEVIRRGVELGVPLALTLSCMQPIKRVPGLEPVAPVEPFAPYFHCGICSKCRERHDAFLEAGADDPTLYADRTYVDAGASGQTPRAGGPHR
jgi:7-cyano-7-deazaguanine synthase